VIETIAGRESRRVGWQQLRNDCAMRSRRIIEWRVLKHIVKQSGDYDDTHGQFSDGDYFE
jgi:hypothetical protein